jgi:hypothetical protein
MTPPDSAGSIYFAACCKLLDGHHSQKAVRIHMLTQALERVSMYIRCYNLVITDVAVGPLSASPSPTTQATIKSGLSMTAPNATDRAYPSSPPSCIAPGVSALMTREAMGSTKSIDKILKTLLIHGVLGIEVS